MLMPGVIAGAHRHSIARLAIPGSSPTNAGSGPAPGLSHPDCAAHARVGEDVRVSASGGDSTPSSRSDPPGRTMRHTRP